MRRTREFLATLPSLSWLAGFVLVPTLIIFVIAFRAANPRGGIGDGWTLAAFRALANPAYLELVWRTLWISAATTVICVTVALPTAFFMARCTPRRRALLLLLVVVPFWTNFLIRVFAWNQILHSEGPLARTLRAVHLLGDSHSLLFNSGAVVLVSVYTFLPFAVLPLFAAAEKFDFGLLDAARDLGASARRAITAVFLPGIRRGIGTAVLIVFVPMLGSYVVPDLVGGADGQMIGNKIAQRNFSDRNLPAAAALSAALTVAVLVPLLVRGRTREDS